MRLRILTLSILLVILAGLAACGGNAAPTNTPVPPTLRAEPQDEADTPPRTATPIPPTDTPKPTATSQLTSTSTPTDTPFPTDTPVPTATPVSEALPTATATPLPPLTGSGGGQIAFTSERDGNAEIYIMNADGSDPQRLTDNPAYDAWPVWSPDGSQIAFTSTRNGKADIYVMDANGSKFGRRAQTDEHHRSGVRLVAGWHTNRLWIRPRRLPGNLRDGCGRQQPAKVVEHPRWRELPCLVAGWHADSIRLLARRRRGDLCDGCGRQQSAEADRQQVRRGISRLAARATSHNKRACPGCDFRRHS